MQTNLLKRNNPNRKRMIVARGGKRGKTSGRGGKGQTARAGNKRRPEWRDIIKKLPKLRGRGKNSNKSVKNEYQKPIAINIEALEQAFNAGEAVTPTTLIEKGVISTISGRVPMVKILGSGQVTKALKISGTQVSESAKAALEKAGGTVVLPKPLEEAKPMVKTEAKPKAEVKEKAEKKPAAKKEKAPAKKTEKTPKAK